MMKKMNSTSRPLVSIITINWNQAQVTNELLASLKNTSYTNYEIIVVDNASKGDDVRLILEAFPEIKLVRCDENLGFSGGNNAGISAADGKYILLLNNDTEVESGFLEPLVEHMESCPGTGIVSPKIYYYDNVGMIQYAGSSGINPYTGRGNFIGHNQMDADVFNEAGVTAYSHGAAMLFSRELLNKIGPLDEQYFAYYEELDFCERARKAGYEIHYVPQSTVFHKESMSIGKANPFKVYLTTRNRLLFMRKNYKGIALWINLLFFTCLALPKNVSYYLARREFRFLFAFCRGFLWHFRNSPSNITLQQDEKRHEPVPVSVVTKKMASDGKSDAGMNKNKKMTNQ